MRRVAVDTDTFDVDQRRAVVHRPAEAVEHPAEQRVPDRNHHGAAGRRDERARPNTGDVAQRHAGEAAFTHRHNLSQYRQSCGFDVHDVADRRAHAVRMQAKPNDATEPPLHRRTGGVENITPSRVQIHRASTCRTRSIAALKLASTWVAPPSAMHEPGSTSGSETTRTECPSETTSTSPSAARSSGWTTRDRKSTRLNSSHPSIS